MATSIKQLAACIGLEGDLSIVRDFFGYAFRGHRRASLLTQARLLQGPHLHLNLIRVGIENFTEDDEREIERAVEQMREIYATVQIGVGRLLRFRITESDAQDSWIVGSMLLGDWAARAVTNNWSAANDGLDVFFVLSWSSDRPGKVGQAPVEGSCDKDGGVCDNSTGCVISLVGEKTGVVLAHEAGHYLGLDHINDLDGDDIDLNDNGKTDDSDLALFPKSVVDNLMFPSAKNKETGILEPWQGLIMSTHCFMRAPC